MDPAVLLTLGVTLGGLATDWIAPRTRTRSFRQWLIETLSNGINQGTTAPLCLVECDGRRYLAGCSLSHRVGFEEEAEELVHALLGEVRDMLRGHDLDVAAETGVAEEQEGVRKEPPKRPVTQFADLPDPALAEDIHWQEWLETAGINSPEGVVGPKATEIKPECDGTSAPTPDEPAIETAAAQDVDIQSLDTALDGIVSRMRACCPAA